MPSVDEAAETQSPIRAALDQGIQTVSLSQVVRFTLYIRLVLPIDGFVFWVRADHVTKKAAFNAFAYNQSYYNEGPVQTFPVLSGGIGDFIIGVTPIGGYEAYVGEPDSPATFLDAQGSLHYASTRHQDEDAEFIQNSVIFTSEQIVNDFEAVGPEAMYVGEFEGLKFAWSARRQNYQQAGIFHYVGDAINAYAATQLVDDPRTLDTKNVIVSNSLPFWLAMKGYQTQPWEPIPAPSFPIYPSFLLPFNLKPPYGVVHIPEENTESLALAPTLGPTLSHNQLVSEDVEITLYGTRNFNAIDFMDFVNQYSLNTENFGLMNSPVIRDAKRTTVEFGIIAQKKTAKFKIDYYQTRARDIARQLIEHALVSYPTPP